MHDEVEWLDPNDDNGVWENQGGVLTVRALMRALWEVSPALKAMSDMEFEFSQAAFPTDLPVEVAWYDGMGTRQLRPMHIDVRANDGLPAALVSLSTRQLHRPVLVGAPLPRP